MVKYNRENGEKVNISISEDMKRRVMQMIPSKLIREYLDSHFEELRDWQIKKIVMFGKSTLAEKAELMGQLADVRQDKGGLSEDWEDTDFRPNAEMLGQAMEQMEPEIGENAVFVLNLQEEYCDDWLLFTSFDAAVEGLKKEVGEDLDEYLQRFGDAGYYYFIEKWIPEENGRMKRIFRYAVLGDGTVTNAEYGDGRRVSDSIYSAGDINLPLPFQPGDIVRVDVRPYAPVKHCLITDMGDNWDCCCVQCLYVDDEEAGEEGGNPSIKILAFKHTFYYEECCFPVAPLLTAEIETEALPENERILETLSRIIKETGEIIQHEKRAYELLGMDFEWG